MDTNAVIALLSGNKSLEEKLNAADWVGVSVISVLEFFAFTDLSVNDRLLFTTFLKRVHIESILSSDIGFLESLAAFKAENKLKMPDAIIAFYAIQRQSKLLSDDKHFEKIEKLSLEKL